jgi:hypothetical protein
MTVYGVAFLSFCFLFVFQSELKTKTITISSLQQQKKRREHIKAVQIEQQIKMVESDKADTDAVCT